MELIDKIIDKNPDAPVIVLFGGNPIRRQEVFDLISEIGNITIHGALNEEEGMQLLKQLSKIDVVLIGGRYTNEQRIRIVAYIEKHLPNTKITQPGVEYEYSNQKIKYQIMNLIN